MTTNTLSKTIRRHIFPIIAVGFLILIFISYPFIYILKSRKQKKKNEPINILFIIATLHIGGTEMQLKNLLKYLDKKRFNPIVCTYKGLGPLEKDIRALNIPIIALKEKSRFNFMVVFDIAKLIKKYDIDIIHTSLFASNFWGRIGALLGNVKIIIASERSASKESYFIIYDIILSYFTDKIICNSQAVKKFQIENEKINPKKLEVIYNGVNLEKFDENLSRAKQERLNYRHRLGIQDDEFVIGNICRITPEKDLLTWLKTAKIIIASLNTANITQKIAETSAKFHALPRNIKFIIVGDATSAIGEETGYKKQVIDLINELGIKNNVIMTGFSDDVTKEFAVMDLFYQSSVIEGFPNSVMEAMAAELPVIATPAGGTEEMITDNENGIIVPMEKPGETTKIIIDLINDPNKMRTMGDNARLTIKNNFSGETLARNTEKLYDQLLSR